MIGKKRREQKDAEIALEWEEGSVPEETLKARPVQAAVMVPSPSAPEPADDLPIVGVQVRNTPSATPVAAPQVEGGVQAPQAVTEEGRSFLKALRRQGELRLKAELAEAQRLQERAKDLARDAKRRQKQQKEVSAHFEFVRNMAEELGFDPGRAITEFPPLEGTRFREVERTTIQEDFAFARVLYDEERNRYEYQVVEPTLNGTEREVLDFLRDTLIRTMEGRSGHETDDWREQLLGHIDRAILDHSILVDNIARQKIQYFLLRDFLGFGRIDVLMRDAMVEDVSCDGPGLPVFLFHRQYESVRTNIVFEDEIELDAYVIGLGQRSGKHISIAEPLLDATLPDGSRLQATLSREVTTRGSSFTVRRFRADPLTPPDLIRIGTMDPAMTAFFWFAMEHGNSIIYAGGTASGKTTTLNAMCLFIPPEKKIVSIEDTREINLRHENWIAGVTRAGFGGETASGKRSGEVDMFKLLSAALRQRPEYLLVGEVRGREAQTLFQAMATGHSTYSTVHADSVSSAVYRLENEPIGVPRMMLQTVNAFAVQVQARVGDRMVRRVKEVVEIVGIDPETGDLLTNRVFDWDSVNDRHVYHGNSHILDSIRKKHNMTAAEIEEEWRNRTRIIHWMLETGVRNINDVSEVIAEYYSRPASLLMRVADWEGVRHGHAGSTTPHMVTTMKPPKQPAAHPNDANAERQAVDAELGRMDLAGQKGEQERGR